MTESTNLRPPNYLTDEQRAEVEKHPDYVRMEGKCPVCRGTGEYRFDGETRECPDDDYGHVALRLFKLYCLGNVPLEYQQLNWDDYPHDDVRDEVAKYLNGFETIRLSGLGWEIMGKKRGVAKTWTATHLLKVILLMGYSGWFVSFMDLKNLYEMEDHERRDFLTSKLMNVEMLVIDDIIEPRSDKMRAFFEDQLETVIRHRTTRNLVTVTTTNMVEDDLEELFPRVYSLMSAKQLRKELDGKDHRPVAWRENQELMLNGEVRPLTYG